MKKAACLTFTVGVIWFEAQPVDEKLSGTHITMMIPAQVSSLFMKPAVSFTRLPACIT